MAEETYSDIEVKPSTLETVDTALYKFVDEVLNLHSETTDGVIKTPVVFASAERSFLSKRSAEGRDNDGTMNLPMISIERKTVSKDFFLNENLIKFFKLVPVPEIKTAV